MSLCLDDLRLLRLLEEHLGETKRTAARDLSGPSGPFPAAAVPDVAAPVAAPSGALR